MRNAPAPDWLCYLATPYTLYPEGLDEAAWAACQLSMRLIEVGIEVFSPTAHFHYISQTGDVDALDPFDHAFWMARCRPLLDRSDCLLVAHMEGWQASFGVAEEIRIFEQAGKPIFDLDIETLATTRRRGPFTYERIIPASKTKRAQGGIA